MGVERKEKHVISDCGLKDFRLQSNFTAFSAFPLLCTDLLIQHALVHFMDCRGSLQQFVKFFFFLLCFHVHTVLIHAALVRTVFMIESFFGLA